MGIMVFIISFLTYLFCLCNYQIDLEEIQRIIFYCDLFKIEV